MNASRPAYFDPAWVQKTGDQLTADVCIYGATAAGIVAAVTAAELGHSVLLLQPGLHLGGMTTGGLGLTDTGRDHVIGGRARKFYQSIGAHYGKPIEWSFEPSVSLRCINALLADSNVTLRTAQFLDQVRMDGKRITEITLLGGLRVTARLFVDASYEGDLLAKAGVSHHIGRESNEVYGETLNGIQIAEYHQFEPARVDPYVRPGDPASGLLPFVEDVDLRTQIGCGDQRVQAYNFRMCMTDDPALKIDWQQPEHYNPAWYELAARWFAQEDKSPRNEHLHGPHWEAKFPVPLKFDLLPNKTPGGFYKTDTNNHSAVSSDFIGANWNWPTADYATRQKLFENHLSYQQGLYWFVANDPRVPARYREAYARWGLPKDEFTQTGHWPHQLYVREARRMISDHVITEHDCTGKVRVKDSVGMGSYTMDSHNCTRFVARIDGKPVVMNEGDVQVHPTDPYPISYRAIVPRRGQCANLLVPVCFSASHIAYGSARMEPVFMVLGESCGVAASLALRDNLAVQDVPYQTLSSQLAARGQVLDTQ